MIKKTTIIFLIIIVNTSFYGWAQRFHQYGMQRFPDTVKFEKETPVFISDSDFSNYEFIKTIRSPNVFLVRRFDSTSSVTVSPLNSLFLSDSLLGKVRCYSYFTLNIKKPFAELYSTNSNYNEFPIQSVLPCKCSYDKLTEIHMRDSVFIWDNIFTLSSNCYRKVSSSQGYDEDVTRIQLWNLNNFSCITIITRLVYSWWPYGDGYIATNSGGSVFYDYDLTVEKDKVVIADQEGKKFKYDISGSMLIRKK